MLVKILALMILTGVASIISAITSFGTSTIIVPILTLVYPFNTVLLFSGLINLFVNFVKVILFRTHIKWQLIFFFGMPAVLLSFTGTFILPFIPEKILLRVLGFFIMSYVVFILKKPNWRLPLKNYITFLGGSFTGISAAIFGMQGAIRTLFLSAYKLPKNVFIFTASILGLIVDCARIGGYAYHQFTFSKPELMPAFLVSVPMVFIGSLTVLRKSNFVELLRLH